MRPRVLGLMMALACAAGCESREEARMKRAEEMMRQVQLAIDVYNSAGPPEATEAAPDAAGAPGREDGGGP